MFTTVKSLTAKYVVAALLISGVFFGFSQTVLAEQASSTDSGVNTADQVVTLSNVAKVTDNGAVIIPPGHHEVDINYVNGKQTVMTVATVVNSSLTGAAVVADPNERVSNEGDTATNDTPSPTLDESVSSEGDFTTPDDECSINCGGDGVEAVSTENSFTTLPDGCTTNCGTNDEAVSAEKDFNTLNDTCTSGCGGESEAISDEHSFTTLPDGCTTNCGTNDEAVSAENYFNTNTDGGGGGGGGGGCVGSCGIGGTGGGLITPDRLLPPGCKPFLLKFIRYGYNNDPYEVRKLQAFLNVFEGYNLPISGIYDRQTEQAVRAFQSKYAGDVLIPWGITNNTGYVFITTLLKINYIYCGITTPIDVDLRSRFPGFEIGPAGLQEIENNFENPTAIPLPVPETATSTGFFQAAAAGLLKGLNWLWDHLCWLAWLLVLILLAIVAYLLMRLRELKQRLARYENFDGSPTETGSLMTTAASSIAAVPLVDALAEEDNQVVSEPEVENWQDYLTEEVPVVEELIPGPIVTPETETLTETSSTEEKTADYENDLKALLDALSERNNKG